MESLSRNWTVQILWITLLNATFVFAAGKTCITQFSGGKMRKYGDCEYPEASTFRSQIEALAKEEIRLARIGSVAEPQASCQVIKQKNPGAKNGIYHLNSVVGVFQTYCDMQIAGGGWTLVASVHENDIRGHCTQGDRWASEHGTFKNHSNGDGFWENNVTYGNAASAASDDYKNPGYFALNVKNLMIWHVPNNTTLKKFDSGAIFKYHTANGFLSSYGGNLASLYRDHYPMRSGIYRKNKDNGPAIPIYWDVGSNDTMMSLLGPNSSQEVVPGFVQFRAINWEHNAYALCPGIKIKDSAGNVEHVCIGSTNEDVFDNALHCGDFSAMYVTLLHSTNKWGADRKLVESVVMIFYR